MIPEYWKEFISKNDMIGKDFEIPETNDLSELGADIKILNEKDIIDEATNFYPGLAVSKDGYLPVGSCLAGNGDPYFINTNDGPAGPLYRIYHDSVDEDGYDKDDAVEIVLKNYEDILTYSSNS